MDGWSFEHWTLKSSLDDANMRSMQEVGRMWLLIWEDGWRMVACFIIEAAF